ncbi:peptidase, partial [Haloarculaceae archaeon H-GB1-1]|nr:peptidase [Haloarculaceae archaeon H-GB1-1]
EPDEEGRERILEIHTEEMNLDDDTDLRAIADEATGFSGAELASLATEAGMFAIRDGRTEVRMADFEAALEKVEGDDDVVGQPVAFY